MKRAHLVRRSPRLGSALPTEPIYRQFDRLFADDLLRPLSLFGNWSREGLRETEWVPAIDIRESEEAYVVTAELPGVSREDVEITLEDNVLTISGERKFDEETKDATYHRIERTYGSFTRSFTTPSQVDSEKVKATFEDGLLTLSVAKAEEAKPRKIEIG